jgi:ketosteroid isomerase-like protein
MTLIAGNGAEEAAIRDVYAQYLSAFHTQRAELVAPFYAPPCLFISDEVVLSFSSEDEVRNLFETIISGLQARDYDHSDVRELTVEMLSDRLAEVSGIAVRFDSSGSELERTGAKYTLRKSGGGWKFVAAVVHTAASAA